MNRIKKIIGIPVRIRPIVDAQRFDNKGKSYSGGSLCNKNILVLNSMIENSAVLFELLNCEGADSVMYKLLDRSIRYDDFIELSAEMVGPVTNVINLFQVDSCDEGKMYKIYNSLQNEVSYLVDNDLRGTISSAVIYGEKASLSDKATAHGLKALIEGLGIKLPNHGLISNGVIAEGVPIDVVFKTLLYLNGKYGCVLDGEVVELKG